MWKRIRLLSLVAVLVFGLLGGLFHGHEFDASEHSDHCLVCQTQQHLMDDSGQKVSVSFLGTVEWCFVFGFSQPLFQMVSISDARAPPFT